MNIRNCLKCYHCSIDFGSPHYSSETPGNEGRASCEKKHWRLDADDFEHKKTLVKNLDMAKTCRDYQEEG